MKAINFSFCFSKLLSGIVVMQVAFSAYAVNHLPQAPEVNATAFILMDANSGKVLAEKEADIRHSPASLAKMMTSYVIGEAIKSGKIGREDIVTISDNAWATGNTEFQGSSLMFLKPGDRVPVSQLTRGINIQSGNDACVAMAEYIAGSQESFVDLMNRYAQELGLENTVFKTVHGLDKEGQFTSARDLAMIGQALINHVPDEYASYKEKEFTFNNIRQTNRNGLLWDDSLQVDGIKTGHTKAAGYNLVASAVQNDMRLIAVVLGSKTFKGREIEAKKLLTWGFRTFETVSPLKADKEFATESVWFGDINQVRLGVEQDPYITIPRGTAKELQASYVLDQQELHAPLAQNKRVGVINFYLDDVVVAQRPLVVMQEVKESGFISRLYDYIRLQFHRWFN